MTTALNPKFTFDSFVVGAANRLAVTAARTVVENPGSAYNPLFIYSGSGLGKTHLLMAIGSQAKKVAPGFNIEYLTLDEYVEAFHAAIAAGQGDAFRRRFQNVDVLLVDDVQFLTGRAEMQTELLRLTEVLQGTGHQIVLTCDRPPGEIAALDERLISRFSGGLVVDMGVPDYETRVAILRRKAEERGAAFQPGVLETVAGAERLARRWRRGGRASPRRSCGGRVRATARTGSKRCSSGTRPRPWTRRSPRSSRTSSGSRRSRPRWRRSTRRPRGRASSATPSTCPKPRRPPPACAKAPDRPPPRRPRFPWRSSPPARPTRWR
ncbi:MAG: hypothetical protein DMD74_01335 [Gemmatimonadetes bacterium]|nr:MAG: hypothetical protein DMD74_01335 [Gemmatimonadota bacterium]